jgi:hypothetical protein
MFVFWVYAREVRGFGDDRRLCLMLFDANVLI